jgi:xanthine/uracil permease
MLGMQAIRVLGTMPQTNTNLFAAGIGLVVGVGVTVLPRDLVMMIPQLFRPFVSSGIIMGFLVAALIHTIFNVLLKGDTRETQTPPTAHG